MNKSQSFQKNVKICSLSSRPFGLYIHWPFCHAKCPYCDFNSHVKMNVDEKIFGNALLTEMTYMASLIPRHPPLSSIFFGGGTPSLMPTTLVEQLITQAQNLFGFTSDIEITAEANPTSVEARKILEFRQAGVNRVSMGIQSLDDASLEFLGREHSVVSALDALNTVRSIFDSISIDLIYALPNQSAKAWRTMLSEALSLELKHLSLYQLTIEAGTIFHTRQRKGEIMTLNDDHAAELYEITQDMTTAAGLPAYEISNHAAIGQECRHNLTYWQAGDWIGVGPGAHGRFAVVEPERDCVSRTATIIRRSPTGWLNSVSKLGHGIEKKETDKPQEWAHEIVMMGLRLKDGINLDSIVALCGPVDGWLDFGNVNRFVEAGWLNYDQTESKLVATPDGRLRLNHILSAILL
jgi:putative oxygen-independent coproporphyrinogen III oxidase